MSTVAEQPVQTQTVASVVFHHTQLFVPLINTLVSSEMQEGRNDN